MHDCFGLSKSSIICGITQARNQDFMWGGGGVLTRPKWTKLPKCIFYLILFN